jgi:hypothetical protein
VLGNGFKMIIDALYAKKVLYEKFNWKLLLSTQKSAHNSIDYIKNYISSEN